MPPPVIPILPGLKGPAGVPDDELRGFVYNVGFLHAAWADTVLQVADLPVLRLHALFLSQSPVLYQMLSVPGSQPPFHLTLPVNDPALTAPAVSTALATLYGHTLDLPPGDVVAARGILAAGALFGLEPVARKGYELLVGAISPATLPELLVLALQPSLLDNDANPRIGMGAYPPYTQGLLAVLVDYLGDHVRPENGSEFDQAFMVLPSDVFKDVVENKLKIESAQRHQLAKRWTHMRGIGEDVVLSFGEGVGVEVRLPRGLTPLP